MKVLHVLLLLPIHLMQGCFWLLWSLWFDDLSLGIALLFVDESNYVVYINKKAGKFQIVRLDLSSKEQVVLFDTHLPIQQLACNGNSLFYSTYSRKGKLIGQITINGNHTINEHNIVADSRNYVLSVNPLSLIEATTTCSDGSCTLQVKRTDANGSQLCDVCYDKLSSLVVSDCGKYIGYSTSRYVSVISNNDKILYELKKVFFMRGHNDKLLAYSRDTETFIIINCIDMKFFAVDLPSMFAGKYVLSASLSPDDKHIAFFVYDVKKQGELVILSLIDNKYRIIAERARIYDIKWSPSEKHISTSGISERDFFEIIYTYKMRNCAVNDKEIFDIKGNVVWRSNHSIFALRFGQYLPPGTTDIHKQC